MCKKLLILTSFALTLVLWTGADAQPTGEILVEYWNDMGTTQTETLYNSDRYPDNPDEYEMLTVFDRTYDRPAPNNDNYAARISGFLYPPETGDYSFWIAADDDCDLFLSTDDDPANKVQIAEINGWCPAYDWDNTSGSDNPDQASAPVALEAGVKYYVEVVYKEGGGGDGAAVAWQGPGIPDRVIIDGAYLSPAAVSLGLLRAGSPNPADGAVDADTTALEWSSGANAVSHKVYLSADETIDDADLAGETELNIQVVVLDPGATYYWRVDEVEADGTVREGAVWSFATLPLEAHFPSPVDGAVWQAMDVQLSWAPGKNVVMHDVYLSADEALVAAADMSTFKGKVFDTSFDPGALEPDTTYYWRVDEFSPTGTNAGPVWSFKTLDPEIASDPSPSDGTVDVSATPTLGWTADESATQDVYLGTDEALVAAGDPNVLLSQQTGTGYAVADALGRGTTLYWKVDVTTADGKLHAGFVNSFRVADQHTDNWASGVGSAGPAYLDTYVQNGAYDIGPLSGDITYEFIVNSNPDETEASMALIGRHGHGDTTVALKYEQWNNTGTYGATVFGVADHDYGVPTAPGEYTHLVFVSSEDLAATDLYVNGELVGSVPTAITLAGVVGIGQAIQDPEGAAFIDNFDGDIFGVAIYDRALTPDEIASNADKYFSPIPITDPDLLIYYDFESGAGSTALDRSGHGNHGQFNGAPQWVGGAVSINIDTLDYIQTAAPLNIVSNTVSVTGWVKHDELPAGWSGILTHRGTSPGCLGLQHDGTELRYMWGADVYWSFSSGLPLPTGEWYFAALTISPDQGKLYLNGVEQTATNVAPHEPTNFDSLIRVGRDHNDGRIMTSLIDEVRFYNRTLTDGDIEDLLQADLPAPVAHWTLDDANGVVALDSSGNALDGALVGDPLWVEGALGGALDLDGVDDYVDCGNDAIFSITDSFTLSLWVNWRATGATWQTVVAKGDNAWRLARGGDTQTMDFGFTGGGSRGWQAARTGTELVLGEWYHVTATYDIEEGAKIYLDSVLEGTNGDLGGITVGDYPVLIGENAQATGRFWDGLIDDVRIYDQALSQSQIRAAMQGRVYVSPNLAANGGLEDDATGAGWSTYGDASMEVVQELVGAAVPEGPIEGSNCLHVTVNSAGANFWDAGLQHGGKVFEAGKSYTLSVWFKSKSGPFDINIKPERAGSPWEGYGSQAVTITEEWAEYTVNTGVIPETVDPASLTFHIAYAPGEFYVDNLMFTED